MIHPICFYQKNDLQYQNHSMFETEGCSLYKHHDAKTVQLCSAGSVFGSSDFVSETGKGPEDPQGGMTGDVCFFCFQVRRIPF